MSLRAFGYLLTRRFSPRGIPRAQSESWPMIVSPAAGRPTRSLHTLRDLDVGNGAAAAAAAFAGLVGILFFRKHTDDSASDVTDEEAKKEVRGNKAPINEDMVVMFEDWMKKHGRAYKDEEEKAMRFEIFKESVKQIESFLGESRPRLPNNLADYTWEEVLKLIGSPYTEEGLRKELQELRLREKQLMKKKAMRESSKIHAQSSDPAGSR